MCHARYSCDWTPTTVTTTTTTTTTTAATRTIEQQIPPRGELAGRDRQVLLRVNLHAGLG